MQIRILGAFGGSTPSHRLTSFLLDGTVCLDAGALTSALTLEEQARIRALLVTHSHMDHVATLPFLVENVFGRVTDPIEVIAPADVIEPLSAHLFNDALWPDFTRLPSHLLPVVSFRTVEAAAPFRVNGLTATAIPVSHVVPTYGYLVSDGASSVLFSGDTGPTEALWRAARAARNLKAVFVECSFSNSLAEVARVSKHLTPATLKLELTKMPPDIPVLLYHMKPPSLPALTAEVAALREPRVRLLGDGEVLTY